MVTSSLQPFCLTLLMSSHHLQWDGIASLRETWTRLRLLAMPRAPLSPGTFLLCSFLDTRFLLPQCCLPPCSYLFQVICHHHMPLCSYPFVIATCPLAPCVYTYLSSLYVPLSNTCIVLCHCYVAVLIFNRLILSL